MWNFFASVKLSFSLLLILAVTSVAGTLLPQNDPAELYLRQFGQTWGGLILGLGLDNMYQALWFRLLMTMLAANLVVCSLNRLPGVLKIIRKDPATDLDKKRSPAHSFTLPGQPAESADKARQALAKEIGKVHEKPLADGGPVPGIVMLAQKGAWSRLGVYVVHLSVLIIFAGGMIGSMFGFKGDMILHQGETLDHIDLGNNKTRPLGFSLRLDKFTITRYPNGMISEYRSDVTFLQNGKEVQKNSMVVNDPAEYGGIDFYQASHGNSPTIKVRVTKGEKTFNLVLDRARQGYPLPDGDLIGFMDVHQNVQMGKMYNGPVARMLYQPKGGDTVGITAFKLGSQMPQRGPVKIELVETKVEPWSGLQVKYDPGVWFIWVGCTLMVIGFIIAFYFAHRKIWIRLEPAGEGRTRLEIAGSTNKNRIGLDRIMERLAGNLRGGQ